MKINNINIKNIFYYIQGNLRYKLYYGEFKFLNKLMRTHIKEQIDLRIKLMDRECYYNGSCKMCGCGTTELQMCNKACENKCYLPMMNKKEWFYFKVMVIDFYKNDIEITTKAVKLLFIKENFDLFYSKSISNIVKVLKKVCLDLYKNII